MMVPKRVSRAPWCKRGSPKEDIVLAFHAPMAAPVHGVCGGLKRMIGRRCQPMVVWSTRSQGEK